MVNFVFDRPLPPTELQEKYVLVKSVSPLDVHFFLWATNYKFACSTLILGQSTPGGPSTFFSNPGHKDNSLGETKDGGLIR